MDEATAKTKWCPFVRMVGTADNPFGPGEMIPLHQSAHNRIATEARERAVGSCIGSACMAWRTYHQWLDNAQEGDPDWVDYAPYAFTPGDGQERDVGYCGLAGRPT